MTVDARKIKAQIERAREKQKQEQAQQQLLEKRSLIDSVSDQKTAIQTNFQKKVRANERRDRMMKVALGVATVVFAVFGTVMLAGTLVDYESIVHPGNKNLTAGDNKFKDIEDYISKNVVATHDPERLTAADFWSGKASQEVRNDGAEYLRFIMDDDFEIASIQADGAKRTFFALCDFGEKGSYYFVIEKKTDKELRVTCIDQFL